MTIDISPETLRLLMVLTATVATHFLARRGLQQAEKIATRTENQWDDALIAAARKPLPVLIWLIGIAFALHLLHRQTGEQLLEYVDPVRNIGVILCVSWFLLSLIREFSANLIAARTEAEGHVDTTTVDGLGKVARFTVIVVAALAVLQTLGFSVSGILAFGGMGGIAVGFAAKDLLSNFFGGLMIHLDRPFDVGDLVRSPDRQIEGRVEQIGWRQTIIRSPGMTPIYVPNSLFTSIVVENPSRMSYRRIRETIGLRYDDLDKLEAISAEIREMLKNHPEVEYLQETVVGFDQFGESSVNLVVQSFCKTSSLSGFHVAKQDILLKIADIVARHGADFAFPTRTVLLNQTPA